MKIGILTLTITVKRYNYGNMLQAYALCKTLGNRGNFVEQINYNYTYRKFSSKFRCAFLKLFSCISHPELLVRYILKVIRLCFVQETDLKYVECDKVRDKGFERFLENIPISKDEFSIYNIGDCVDRYDTFVVGSDQVWTGINATFGLDFVPSTKKRISYAASCARTVLRPEDVDGFKKYLPKFDAISVREQDSVALLQPYAGKNKIEWVLDPTMLLTREDWDEICPKQLVEGKYMFCYFLGPDKNMRDVAQKYAKAHDLKLVTLPHLTGKILADVGFGDEQLYDISPADFLSLIKYADCVFTDSFHGSVISLLYHKQFYTFSRLNMPHMDNRMTSLLSMFDAEERFLNIAERMTVEYVEQLQDLDYSQEFPKFEEMKKSSVEFLEKALR